MSDRSRETFEANIGQASPQPEIERVAGASLLAPTPPPPAPTRRHSDEPRIGQFNEEQRARVNAAVAFHIGGKLPGIEWTGAVQPIADRFADLAAGDPMLVSALEQDVNTMFALMDMDIARKVMEGEPVSQFGDVFDAIAEVAWEVGATDLAARLNEERTDSVKGTFDALTGADAFVLGEQSLADDDFELPAGAPVSTTELARVRGGRFETLFDVPGAWSFSPSSGMLAVTVGDQTVGVEVRPGFEPESHLEVMAEVVSAQMDGRLAGGTLTGGQAEGGLERMLEKAHEVGGWLQENPAAQTSVDMLWSFFSPRAGGGPFGPEPGPIEQAALDIRNEEGRITETSIRMASAIPFPEDAVVAAVAHRWIEESEGEIGSQDALTLAGMIVEEDRDNLVSEFESLTREALIRELEAGIEDESALGRAVETSLSGALDKLEAWDRVTQFIGVNLIDAWWDITEGAFDLASGDWEEGFGRLSDVMDGEEFGVTAADYFDLEGSAADGANLAVGIGFDPLNWIFAGAAGVRGIARKALTNPKFAPLYLKTGSIRQVTKSIAGEVGETAGTRGIRNVAAMSGLDDTEIIDLVKLAQDPDATVGQVEEVLTRALSKDWLGEGPGRAIRHSTVEGLGRTLESLAAGKIADEHMDTIMKMFAKLSVGRTFRLGENQALDNIADLLTQFFPADKDKFAHWFTEAVQRRAAAGDEVGLLGVNQMTKEAARRSIWETGGTVRAIEGADDLRTVGQNLRTIEDQLARLDDLVPDEAARGSVRDQLERMHSVMARRVDDAQPKIQNARDKKRLAHKQLKQASYLEADSAANAARNEMGAVVYELYDDIAEQMNTKFGKDLIPVVKGKTNPLAPHVPVRDWSAVTGTKKLIAGDDPDLGLMMGLAVDDVDQARAIDAVGMFNRSQHVLLPASPYEVILFDKIGHSEKLLSKATAFMRGERMKKFSRGYKFLFAANLLVNPLTAGKITLDETLRFLADTGDVGKFLRSTLAGVPGVGRGTEGAVNWVKSRFGDAVSNPYALSYRRNVGGWSADDFADYGWVVRPKATRQLAAYREQAERWVNGTLLNDRRFREYARWVDNATVLEDGTKIPPKEFVEWWDNGAGLGRPGHADTRMTRVTIRDSAVLGTELTASEAFNIIDNIFDHWLTTVVDESARGPLKRTLLQAARGARGGLSTTGPDARLLNAIGQVPGLQANDAFGSTVFNVFFGAPSGRRAGVFYEYYFDEAMQILSQRHAGRVLTADDLMDFADVDKQTAQHWLKQGSDNKIVAQLMADRGVRTEAHLAARAGTYAERRADDLMYRFTSMSLAGRGVEAGLMFPFARAQVDFLSWWYDHLTKPMMFRMSPEVRAKMPQAVQTLMQGVEQAPVNLRAWAKFSHLAAALNNDQESVIDQTVDSLTFFPLRFDSNFLLDVTPQFGPVPSWLFDIMVDKGMIPDEAADNIEALFPALDFTDAQSDDLFDRILPSSRRSLRDLSAGMMRSGYAMFGQDVHTDPSIWGKVANILADEKVPAATGDFQTAFAADFLGEHVWDMPPGSEAFNREVLRVAVEGAVEANKQEWGQDIADRTLPLTGYDREYQALRAYDGFFDEDTFSLLEQAGLFQINDLLDVDGQPRIRKIWDDYQEGRASVTDLEWLRDRLAGAYFEAGRTELAPGFSMMDYLHLKYPQVAVNLINKSEDSGIPVRSDAHAEFKQQHVNQLTGRLQNIPPGDTGRELIADARRNGWIVSRPVEEWLKDASAAVYKSGQRATRAVWERVSHRTWHEGLKQSIENKRFTLDSKSALILEQAGLDIDAGTEFTYKDFHQVLDDFDERFDVAQPVLLDTIERGAVHGQLAKHDDEFGLGLIEDIGDADRELNKQGIESVEDWPEDVKQRVRDRFAEAVTLGYTTLEDYTQEIAPIFGPLDYEPPTPPPVADLDTGFTVSGDELQDVQVIDGDTLSVLLADGPMRVRLIGINAPEVTQPGYQEARDSLARVIEGAGEVTVGVYKPELFGLTQLSAPGEHRLLAWLYIDGIPVYDASVFTADNPRGAGVGGTVLDLEAILEENR